MSGPVVSVPNSAGNANPAAPQGPALTSSDFLQILVAEFQNQDPTSPTDPTQYATQLVDFSNLGQLENIDQAVQPTPTQQLMQASSAYLGRQVVAAGSQIGVKGGKATSIDYVPATADNYTALVFDGSGREVDSVSLGNQPAGSLQTFSWSPSSSIGDGTYSVRIVNSKNVALNGLLEQGTVQNVSLSSSGLVLDLGNLTLTQDQIARIAQP